VTVIDTELIKKIFTVHSGYQKSDISIDLLGEIAPAFGFEECGDKYYYKNSIFETNGHLISKIEGNDFKCRSNGLVTSYGYLLVNFLISGTVTGVLNGEQVCFDGSDPLTQNFIWTGDCDVDLKYKNVICVTLFYNYTPNCSKINGEQVANQLAELISSYFSDREALVRLAAQEFGNEIILNLLTVSQDLKIKILKSFNYAALQNTAANKSGLKYYAHRSKISVATASRALYHGKSLTKVLKKNRKSESQDIEKL